MTLRTAAPERVSPSRRLALLVALSSGALLSTATSVGISPFLLDIAHDLDTDLTAAGNLVALQSISWGFASLLAGSASDRLGRRPLLVAGLGCLVISAVGVVTSSTYLWVALWRIFGGLGGGAYMGTVFATVSDHVPPGERGRALGWVVTGQSLALVLGVPAMTLAGGVGGWRGAVIGHGLVVLAGACAVWLTVPPRPSRALEQPLAFGAVARLVGPRVLTLLAAGTTERVCYAAVAVFLPTFLLTRYDIDAGHLALGLGLIAAGNLLGNLLGGQLSDRVRAPQLVLAASLVMAGAVSVPTLGWAPAVPVSVLLGFAYTLVNATGRPALLTLLSEVSPAARGAVLGLNITFASFGWLAATVLGGLVVASAGFAALSMLTLACGLLGGALSLAAWLLPRLRQRALGADVLLER